jgi:hypothetical protein
MKEPLGPTTTVQIQHCMPTALSHFLRREKYCFHCSDISIGFLTCVYLRRTLCARSSGLRRTVTSSHPATDMFIVGGLYALAFLERGGLWRHRIRNWYVYRVSRDIESSFSLNNDPAISTTRGDTCIDAVFRRHVEYLQTMNFVSYFSYHKPRHVEYLLTMNFVSYFSYHKPRHVEYLQTMNFVSYFSYHKSRHVEYLQTMNFVSYFSYNKPLLSITAQPHSVTCDDIPVQWFLWEIIVKYINKCRLRHIHDPVFLS